MMAGEGVLLSPLEQERRYFGYNLEDVRGKPMRIIHLKKEGDEESDTCVFFSHGGGGRGCQFKYQFKPLQAHADIVACDNMGCGDSPAPNQPELYTEQEIVEDLYAIFMKYRKARNFIVAHCYGGIHALRLVKKLRDEGEIGCVKGLVIISLGTTLPVPPGASVFLMLPTTVMEWLRPLARASSNATIFTPNSDPTLVAFENHINSRNPMFMMKVQGKDCSDQTRWDGWLAEGKDGVSGEVPVTMICGGSDGVFSVESCRQLATLLEIGDDHFHVIEGVAHLSMLEKPDQVSGIITDFFQQC